MHIWISIFLIACTLNIGKSQNQFLATYDFGTTEIGHQIIEYQGRLFVLSATYCGIECAFISEIDIAGNILWKTEIPDIDVAHTMIVAHDTITVSGNNDPYNTLFRLAHFSLYGTKLGETHEIEHPTLKFTRMFQLAAVYFAGKYILCGSGSRNDIESSLMFVVDRSGKLDTLIQIEPMDLSSDIWDCNIDHMGRLTTYHYLRRAHSPVNFRKVFKFNEDFDTVWSYATKYQEFDLSIPRGCGLKDGRTILSYSNPQVIPYIYSLRAINENKSIDWQHNYTISPYRQRSVYTLKTLSNGDIMGSGVYSERDQDPVIDDSPWLFRMSPEGELLWEHTYFDIDSTNNQSRRGIINDFVELPDGDILAVGALRYQDQDLMIMRLDSNGCLNANDCETEIILTSSIALTQASRSLLVYPNPVSNVLDLYLETTEYQLSFDIISVSGRVVRSGHLIDGSAQEHVEKLSQGIYRVNIHDNGKALASSWFVKIKE